MAAKVGRTATLGWGTDSPLEQVAGIREKSVTMNGEAIDITSDDDDGWRTVLDVTGENSIEMTLSGITKSATLKNTWFNGDRLQVATLTYADGGVLSGEFYMQSYSETVPYKDAISFEMTLVSSGVVAYAPGSPLE